jgi:SAM-dependent methyltransferase
LLNGLLPKALPERCTIIDIGCGNGTYLAFLHRMLPHSQIVGIEPSPAAKVTAPPEIAQRIITGELLGIAPTLEPASFDLAICSEVLEHVADPEASLHSIRTLLKPGGNAARHGTRAECATGPARMKLPATCGASNTTISDACWKARASKCDATLVGAVLSRCYMIEQFRPWDRTG